MRGTESFVICAVHTLLVACTSTSDHAGGVKTESPRLEPVAVRELEALGYRKYENTAVIAEETPEKRGTLSVAPAKVTFDPASGPICMSGRPYSVWYADRNSDDLILLLDGGGACWSSLCSASGSVDQFVSGWAKVFAFPEAPPAAPEDPPDPYAVTLGPVDDTDFSDWNAVSIPYCDGSVFMGDNDVPVPSNGDVRHFHGRQNLAAALDVAVAHFPHPKRVLLVGWSAGGYGTITGMVATRLRYPDAELYVLDDSGPGVSNLGESADIEQRLSEWNYASLFPQSCTECDGGRGQFAYLFDWMLERDRDVRIGVASYFQDDVIPSFLRMPPESYEPLLRETLTPIHEAHPDRFKRFMLPGQGHVLSVGWNVATAGVSVTTAAGVQFDTWTVAMTNRGDDTWADIQADCAYACCHEDRASCEAEPGCTAVSGRDAPDHPDTFAGCIPTPSKCDDGAVCAFIIDDRETPNVKCRQFPNACVPSGWQPYRCDNPALADCGHW